MANAITRATTTDKEYKLLADHVPYVAEDDCIACGTCEEICPEVFTVNETLGFAQVMNPSGAPDGQNPGGRGRLSGPVHPLGR